MGAALHVAHVHELPPRKRKRKGGGGGGGDDFYGYAKRIYADKRADRQTRELLLALAYAVCTVGAAEGDDEEKGKEQWHLVRKALDCEADRHYLRTLLRNDLPRYVPPEHRPGGWAPHLRRCKGPRLRPYRARVGATWTPQQIAAQAKEDEEDFRNVLNICGEPGKHRVLEKQPGTGWHILHYFCDRHREDGLRVKEAVAEQNRLAPEPVPNAGGLLPVYFNSDWLKYYRWVSHSPTWEPPVYGICADDWPVPGKEPVPSRARLRLASMDGELVGG